MAPRPRIAPPCSLGSPQGRAESLPLVVGHCWTDTGGKKQEKACVGEKAARRSPQAAR